MHFFQYNNQVNLRISNYLADERSEDVSSLRKGAVLKKVSPLRTNDLKKLRRGEVA